MRFGRLRLAEIAILLLSLILIADVTLADWSGGIDESLAGWLAFACGVLGLLCFQQTIGRAVPTGGIAAAVTLSVLGFLAVLVLGLALLAPGPFRGPGSAEGPGLAIAFGGCVLLWASAVWSLRDESRGFRPEPAASAEVLALPEIRTTSADG